MQLGCWNPAQASVLWLLHFFGFALLIHHSKVDQQFEENLGADFGALSLRLLFTLTFCSSNPISLGILNSTSVSLDLQDCCFLLGLFPVLLWFGKCLWDNFEVNMECSSVLLFLEDSGCSMLLMLALQCLQRSFICFSNFKLLLVDNLVQYKLHCWVPGQKCYPLNFNFNSLSFLNVALISI